MLEDSFSDSEGKPKQCSLHWLDRTIYTAWIRKLGCGSASQKSSLACFNLIPTCPGTLLSHPPALLILSSLVTMSITFHEEAKVPSPAFPQLNALTRIPCCNCHSALSIATSTPHFLLVITTILPPGMPKPIQSSTLQSF